MPLLADTIVECGRRTLSNAIALATKWGTNRNSKYFGAEVVYGDTGEFHTEENEEKTPFFYRRGRCLMRPLAQLYKGFFLCSCFI